MEGRKAASGGVEAKPFQIQFPPDCLLLQLQPRPKTKKKKKKQQ